MSMERKNLRSLTRGSAVLLLAASTVVLPACGGGGGSGPTPVQTTQPPVRSLIQQGGFQLDSLPTALSAGLIVDAGRVEFSTSGAGTLEVNVDWTFASNDVDFVIMRGNCSFNQFYAEQCQEVASAEGTTKPERLTLSNFAAGGYTLFVVNLGLSAESGNYQIYLTR
jgi:hypothetical protein